MKLKSLLFIAEVVFVVVKALSCEDIEGWTSILFKDDSLTGFREYLKV